jgi:hypothetical protein
MRPVILHGRKSGWCWRYNVSGCEKMVRILWEVKIVDAPFCCGMDGCFVKSFHIWLFGNEIFSHEQWGERGSSVGKVAEGKSGHVCSCSATRRQNTKNGILNDAEDRPRFPFVTTYHMGSVTWPVKDPLDRKCEDACLLRYACSYLHVQIPEILNLQISYCRIISLFLFNELLLLPRQMFFF